MKMRFWRDAAVRRDVVYGQVGDYRLKLDVYPPTGGNVGAAAAVVYVHGGGWVIGDKLLGIRTVPGLWPLVGELRRHGYLVAAINYRLAPFHKWPAPLLDVAAAVDYLRANAATYRLDPERIGLLGDSAGGHLASLYALTTTQPVQAVVSLSGPSDLTYLHRVPGLGWVLPWLLGGERAATLATLRAASPLQHVSAASPPFMIVQGLRDVLVPPEQARRLHTSLQAAGVASDLIMVENATHALLPLGWPRRPTLSEINRRVVGFLQRYL